MKRVIVSLITLLGIGTAAAQQEEGPRVLSLDEALEITMTSNPTIEALRYEEKAAQQERRAAIGLRMPQINVNGAYTYLGDDIKFDLNHLKGPVNQFAGDLIGSGLIPSELLPSIQGLLTPLMGADWALKLQDRSLGFVGGNVTLPIYMGGKINTANRAARINEAATIEQGNQSRNALVSELVERYYGLALARQVVEVRQQVVDGVRRHLEDAIALEKNGMIAQSERLYIEFKMSEAERDLQNARLQVETLSDALKNTLGQSIEAMPVTTMFILNEIEDVAYYKDLAEKFNPLLNQVALKKQLAQEGVKLQRAEFLPQIAAMGGASFYNYQVSTLVPRWAVGVGVNIKLFDGLNREYKHSAAKQTVKQVASLERKASNDIAVLIEKLYNQMMNYANQMTSIDSSLNFAEEYLRAKNAAFLEGMSSSSDLVDAELNLARVRTERMQAAYNYDVALAQLLEAAGISEEFINYLHRDDARPIHFDKK
ncbi:MAG TPA: TolC family protein [Candidatus Alistipes avicola]|uniref:TolC family protein n=1 Tax=Candidatus Alistipes avicola TaxID=2838432 RepID=A0A9D2IEU0_9BACT|nr:TolC family protein [uncultured Alistipes sp.]HJA98637.1 TolC family protein [Candidatus Alistipes avicola]